MQEITVYNSQLQSRAAISADLFRRFIEYTDREPTTTKGYITCLRQFANWITATGTTQPERADILAYKEYLNGAHFGRSGAELLKAGTKQQYLRAVKHFFKWTAAEGIYPNIADNIHGVKINHDTHKKDALDREAVKIIADHIDRSTEAPAPRRPVNNGNICSRGGTRGTKHGTASLQLLFQSGGGQGSAAGSNRAYSHH